MFNIYFEMWYLKKCIARAIIAAINIAQPNTINIVFKTLNANGCLGFFFDFLFKKKRLKNSKYFKT